MDAILKVVSARIKAELEEAGVASTGTHRFIRRHLATILHRDEHIMAATFGRLKESEGLFGLIEGALIATDKRIIFVSHRPGYTTMDEVNYDIVSGVTISEAALYTSITLFTKIATYTLSFTKPASAERFASYIEERAIDHEHTASAPVHTPPHIDRAMLDFLAQHELGVLSSIDRTGNVTGAAIYYTMYNGTPYFMTKSSTRKATDILGNQHIALTVVDEHLLQTAQLQGIVEAASDEQTKHAVIDAIIKPRHYASGSHLPPVMKLEGDTFIIFRITPTELLFTDYSQR